MISTREKAETRKFIRQQKRAYETKELAELSDKVVERLTVNERWQQAKTVLLYHSLPDEVATHALIQKAVEAGKRVLLPVVVGDDLELREFRRQEALHEGAFHIQEPDGIAFTDYAAIDLAVIPGMAFTADGRRLGRGKGYYDRLLSRLSHVYKIGICWPFQLLDELPAEAHDIRMDAVVTTSEQLPQ